MYKTLIKLPDGTFVSSGPNESIYIKDCKIRESVNSGHEMQLGSVCATEVTLSLGVVSAPLSITKGQTLEIYKVDDTGKRWNVGIFTAEQPTKTSAHTYKVTTYDHVLKLEKDIAAWLNSLTGWPYTLSQFAQMVCEACGVELRTTSFPNADFLVNQFTATSITGRQIMEWVGQLAARFVRAHYSGSIELAWYTKHIKTLQPTGSNYYLAGSLQYEDYNVEPIDAVQVQMAEQDHAFLWPEADPGANSYILKDNRLITQMNEAARECLATVLAELGRFSYRPCKVSIPATIHIHAGDILQVQTLDGQTFSTYVMTKTQTGNKDTLECTGSARRDDATAYDDNPKHSVVDIVGDALRGQTQQDIFNKLTNYGKAQGVFLQDGELFINASLITAGILQSLDKSTFYLDLVNGVLKGKFNELSIEGKSVSSIAKEQAQKTASEELQNQSQEDIFNKLTNNGTLPGLYMQDGQLFVNASYMVSGVLDAALVTVKNLIAETLVSKANFGTTMEVRGGILRLLQDNKTLFHLTTEYAGASLMRLTSTEASARPSNLEISPWGLQSLDLSGTRPVDKLFVGVDVSTGLPVLSCNGVKKAISWKQNSDGTFTLVGK